MMRPESLALFRIVAAEALLPAFIASDALAMPTEAMAGKSMWVVVASAPCGTRAASTASSCALPDERRAKDEVPSKSIPTLLRYDAPTETVSPSLASRPTLKPTPLFVSLSSVTPAASMTDCVKGLITGTRRCSVTEARRKSTPAPRATFGLSWTDNTGLIE